MAEWTIFRGQVISMNTKYSATAAFTTTTFKNDVYHINNTFMEANYRFAKFRKNVSFSGSEFEGGVNLREAEI